MFMSYAFCVIGMEGDGRLCHTTRLYVCATNVSDATRDCFENVYLTGIEETER
jgi:hypothetical protein